MIGTSQQAKNPGEIPLSELPFNSVRSAKIVACNKIAEMSEDDDEEEFEIEVDSSESDSIQIDDEEDSFVVEDEDYEEADVTWNVDDEEEED